MPRLSLGAQQPSLRVCALAWPVCAMSPAVQNKGVKTIYLVELLRQSL